MLQQDDPVHKRLPVLAFAAWMGILVIFVFWPEGPRFFSQGVVRDTYSHSLFSRETASLFVPADFSRTHREFAYVPVEESLSQKKSAELLQFEEKLHTMVEGHPIEAMIPFISQQERTVAALLVGIAKKESNWGKRVPRDAQGGDCYNYWGYRGAGSLGLQRLGYGCFASPEEAIRVVGGRIHELAIEKNNETPSEMIIWKCGSSCAGHSPESVRKWISDVDAYYSKLVARNSNTAHNS